jgi:hypothetical protein
VKFEESEHGIMGNSRNMKKEMDVGSVEEIAGL